MEKIKDVEERIGKAQVVLQEARENHEKNPEDYSAQLLLLSTENYISDLMRELDILQMKKNLGK